MKQHITMTVRFVLKQGCWNISHAAHCGDIFRYSTQSLWKGCCKCCSGTMVYIERGTVEEDSALVVQSLHSEFWGERAVYLFELHERFSWFINDVEVAGLGCIYSCQLSIELTDGCQVGFNANCQKWPTREPLAFGCWFSMHGITVLGGLFAAHCQAITP